MGQHGHQCGAAVSYSYSKQQSCMVTYPLMLETAKSWRWHTSFGAQPVGLLLPHHVVWENLHQQCFYPSNSQQKTPLQEVKIVLDVSEVPTKTFEPSSVKRRLINLTQGLHVAFAAH